MTDLDMIERVFLLLVYLLPVLVLICLCGLGEWAWDRWHGHR